MKQSKTLQTAIKITTDDSISRIDLDEPLYKSVRNAIGGLIEIVRARGLKHPHVMIVDEEGLIKNRQLNKVGSLLYGTPLHGQPIVGDIVIMREEEGPDGMDIFGLNSEDITYLTEMITKLVAK